MTVEPDLRGAVVLVVHAHPDDEVFAMGAATIAATEAGARVQLKLFTGGEGWASTTSLPGLAAARRYKEVRLAASTRLLGIDDWAYLAAPGRWTDTPHHPARTIATAFSRTWQRPLPKRSSHCGPTFSSPSVPTG